MSVGENVRIEIDAGVAVVTMSRPERRNAFDDAMWGEFTAAFDAVLEDRRVRVVVLTGDGGNFTAGADVALVEGKGEAAASDGGPHPFLSLLDHLVENFDKPLIAAVDGVAVGFGVTVLLHADFVFVSERARLRAPFVRLGVVPEAGSSFLFPAVLGIRRATEFLLTADFVDGRQAVGLGIANRCVPAEELLGQALATARRIAGNPPEATRATKRLLLDARRDAVRSAIGRENAAFARRMGSPENQEAIRAFREKRPPDFSDSGSE